MDEMTCFRKDLELIFACDTKVSMPNDYRQLAERFSKRIPCICPIINSLSNLSVPASSSSLPPRASRNFLLKPTNQFSQKGFVAERLVRHTQGRDGSLGSLSSYNRDGTEARADVVFRIVRERVLVVFVSHGGKKGQSGWRHTAIQFQISGMEIGWDESKDISPYSGEHPLQTLLKRDISIR